MDLNRRVEDVVSIGEGEGSTAVRNTSSWRGNCHQIIETMLVTRLREDDPIVTDVSWNTGLFKMRPMNVFNGKFLLKKINKHIFSYIKYDFWIVFRSSWLVYLLKDILIIIGDNHDISIANENHELRPL